MLLSRPQKYESSTRPLWAEPPGRSQRWFSQRFQHRTSPPARRLGTREHQDISGQHRTTLYEQSHAFSRERRCFRPPQRSGEPHKMARLVGVDLPREKRIEIALTYIFGVGRTRAQQALAETGVNPDTRVRDLGDDELVKLKDYLTDLKIEGDLRREIAADIRRKVEIGSYQGIRHRRGLPVRGQRTKTNARGRKGPNKTMAGKKRDG